MTSKYWNRSISRAFSVLDLFDEDTPSLSAKEAAERLGLTNGGLHPTLRNLVQYGYLARDENKKYSLGFKILERANQLLRQLDLRAEASEPMRLLSRTYNESTRLSILYEGQVMHLALKSMRPSVVHREAIGTLVPAYCTALGKVLLAHLEETQLNEYLKDVSLTARTPSTITNPGILRQELEYVRQRGIAFDRGEFHEDIRCIAAPIKNYGGVVIAAISMSTRKSTLEDDELKARTIEDVKKTAVVISEKLGFVLPGEEKI